MMNDAQTGNITGHNTIASALTNIVTGKEDANFSSPNGKYNFFTCSSNTESLMLSIIQENLMLIKEHMC
ncbi:MAG: hypothetical protein ACLUBO_13775 [Coprococcus sp.]|jgi:hypothetical protein